MTGSVVTLPKLIKFEMNLSNQIEIPQKSVNNLALPVLGLGTYQIEEAGQTKAVELIREAVRLGFRHIDTAESYGDGKVESLVGEAIRSCDRNQLILTTKVSRRNLAYDDLIRSAMASRERLGLKSIYLYLIHAPNQAVPLKESLRAMAYLLESGLVEHIGVSNFDKSLLAEAVAASRYPIVSNQIHYSLASRDYEDNGTLEFCRKNNILVTAYRAIGFGQLDSGHQILSRLSDKYAKTAPQIALNWLINKPGVVALVKSSNIDHLKDNPGAIGWRLESEDEKDLDKNFPRGETINTP